MATTDWRIRDFTSDDYRGVVRVDTEVYPDLPKTIDELVEFDKNRDPRCRWRRWVADCKGRLVGFGYYAQYAAKFHSQTFYIGGGVLKEFQSLGIGTALYNRVMQALRAHEPRLIRAHARADRAVAVRFLESRGYQEYRREGDSVLEVAKFDGPTTAGLEDRLRQRGIQIRTLSELAADPDRDRKLYDLDWEVTRDEPGSGDDTRVDFETFVEKGINASHRLPDGYFVAVRGDEYIGLCLLNAIKANGTVKHGITGVKRPYRRMGVATALKVRAILYAREAGVPRIYTDNAVGNRAMLSINERLGFVRLPDWIFYEAGYVT